MVPLLFSYILSNQPIKSDLPRPTHQQLTPAVGQSLLFVESSMRQKEKLHENQRDHLAGKTTSHFEEMVYHYQNILGLAVTHREPGFVVMDLPNGDRVEVFEDESPYDTFFTNPVADFLVDDIAFAHAEMEAQGIEFIGPIEVQEDGNAWTYFHAPDGFIYELMYSPKHPGDKSP